MNADGKYLSNFQRKHLEKKLVELEQNLTEYSTKVLYQGIKIMLLADAGENQAQIGKTLNCAHPTVRNWVHIARSGMAHDYESYLPGRPKKITPDYQKRLGDIYQKSPKDYGYAFKRWTNGWLAKHLAKEFGIELSAKQIGRLVKQEQYLSRLKELLDENPRTYGYSVSSWTAEYLRQQLAQELKLELSEHKFSSLLKERGLSVRSNQNRSETKITQLNQRSRIEIPNLNHRSSSHPNNVFSINASFWQGQ